MDFNKEFIHSFGDCVQAIDDRLPKNNNLPRSIDLVYLRADNTLQGGHELMELTTGRVSGRLKVAACAMMHMVIDRGERIASKQGYNYFKFFNRKNKELVLRDTDLLEGVVGENGEAILDDEECSSLPPLLSEGERTTMRS